MARPDQLATWPLNPSEIMSSVPVSQPHGMLASSPPPESKQPIDKNTLYPFIMILM
jgi:hypothetical protein